MGLELLHACEIGEIRQALGFGPLALLISTTAGDEIALGLGLLHACEVGGI